MKTKVYKIIGIVLKTLGWLFFALGLFFVSLCILALTDVPYNILRDLAYGESGKIEKPAYLVVLGGSGMPSESNLMRLYFAAEAAKKYPDAKIIISLPGDTTDSTSSLMLMKKELILKGCSPERIMLEHKGENTRAEAINIREILGEKEALKEIVIITSPTHTRRALRTFVVAGMPNVKGLPAFEVPGESNFVFDDRLLGGKQEFIPTIGENLTLRYQFWNHLKYEVDIIREWFALKFYQLKGWAY